jgi:hypothetical protein
VTSQPSFSEQVARRKRLCLFLFAMTVGSLGVGIAVGTNIAFALSMATSGASAIGASALLFSLSCPSCRHPFFWDEKGSYRDLGWLRRSSCAHCGRQPGSASLVGSSTVGTNSSAG